MSLILLSSICLLGAQQSQIKPKSNPADVAKDTRPVTCEEASKVFSDARTILGRVLHVSLGSSSIAASATPVTREQVIGEMASLTGSLGPKIKFTPHAQAYSASLFHVRQNEAHNLTMLVRLGYVGKVSPLATSAKDTLTVGQFGEALGFYLARTAELTHMPSPKWSPILGAGS